ncbi:MAG TPA: tetratricopeptide repeat protein [Candidatus Nitrosotenuis sp.]|nr:tetratricopeptide repeat protein [Candidatus Nitrosotenuis sp.]
MAQVPEGLLERLVRRPERRPALLAALHPAQRREILGQALAHVDVHLAQGHRRAARQLLALAEQMAGEDQEMGYRVARKRVRWLEAEGLVEEAILAMRKLYATYQRSRRHPQRGAELAMELGILLDRAGRKDEALRLFRSAALRYARLGHSYNRAAALFNAASVLYDLGRVGHSLNACLRALQEGGSGHLDMEAHITLQLANSYESRGDVSTAEEFYRYAAEGYRRLNNRKQESDILYRLGWLALRRGEHRAAEPILNRSLQLKREHDYGLGLARYHLSRAESYRSSGLSDAARHHYRAGLGLAALLGAEDLATRCRFGLFLLSGQDSRALPGFLKMSPPTGMESSLARGRHGVYCEQFGDGVGTPAWRQSGGCDASPGDRTFLVRVLKDLSRAWKHAGMVGHEQLRRQERAVQAWQTRSRRKTR